MKRCFVGSLCLLCLLLNTRLASATVIDIAFVLDSSGSVREEGWELEKSFVSNLVASFEALENGNTQIRYGIVSYSREAFVEWTFADPQDDIALVTNHINNLPFLARTTSTRTAIDTTIGLFDDFSAADHYQKAFFITDGNPFPESTQNPCKTSGTNPTDIENALSTRTALANSSIDLSIVGVGDRWTPSALECLVKDPVEDMYLASDFSNSELDAIRDLIIRRIDFPDDSDVSQIPAPSALVVLIAYSVFVCFRRSRRRKLALL